MSGNSKYVDNIRRIVGIDTNQSNLRQPGDKSNLNARRGTGYKASDSAAAQGRPSEPGKIEDVLPKPADTADNGGNTVNPNSPNDGSYGYDDGTVAADDSMIDNLPSPDIGDGNGDTLNGISGLIDPNTGKEFELRFDGMERPPTDWEGDEPANEWDRWTQGTEYYSDTDAGATVRATASMVASALAIYPYLRDVSPNGFGAYSFWYASTPSGLGDFQFINVIPQNCTPGESDSCPLDFKVEYPSDNVMQMVLDFGKWVVNGHEPDSDIISSYTDNQHSRIDAKFGTDRYVSILPTKSGGHIIAETNTLGGTYTNNKNVLINSYGKAIDYVAGDMIDSYLP